jgi:hypothetical protein
MTDEKTSPFCTFPSIAVFAVPKRDWSGQNAKWFIFFSRQNGCHASVTDRADPACRDPSINSNLFTSF